MVRLGIDLIHSRPSCFAWLKSSKSFCGSSGNRSTIQRRITKTCMMGLIPVFAKVSGFRLPRVGKQWPHSGMGCELIVFSILTSHQDVYFSLHESTAVRLVLVASFSSQSFDH